MMIPGLELRFISDTVGRGVCTTRPIARGTIVWVLDPLDLRIREAEYRALPALLRAAVETYAYVEDGGDRILCWDLGRYMNHSCAPTGANVEGLFEIATRDIAAGDELTCDYAMLNITLPSRCTCGSPSCRGTAAVNDLDAHRRSVEREAAAAVALAGRVEQPLAALLEFHPTLRGLLDAGT